MDQHVACNLRGTLQFHGLYFQKPHQVLMVKIQVGSIRAPAWSGEGSLLDCRLLTLPVGSSHGRRG